MKQELFDQLMTSVGEALEHAQGTRTLRTTELPAAPQPMLAAEIKAVRDKVQASQAVFARYLNVSTKLVQAWEAGRRNPEGAALKLLRITDENPEAVFSGMTTRQSKATQVGAPRRKPVMKRKAMVTT